MPSCRHSLLPARLGSARGNRIGDMQMLVRGHRVPVTCSWLRVLSHLLVPKAGFLTACQRSEEPMHRAASLPHPHSHSGMEDTW